VIRRFVQHEQLGFDTSACASATRRRQPPESSFIRFPAGNSSSLINVLTRTSTDQPPPAFDLALHGFDPAHRRRSKLAENRDPVRESWRCACAATRANSRNSSGCSPLGFGPDGDARIEAMQREIEAGGGWSSTSVSAR